MASIVAIVIFLIVSTFTLHIHVMPDGRIVAHSHATANTSSQNGDGSHSHTIVELLVFSFFAAIEICFLVVFIWIASKSNIFSKRLLSRFIKDIFSFVTSPLRAPPVIS